MEQQPWGKRGLITVEHLKALEYIYKDREDHLRDAHILGNDPAQVERSMAISIETEKNRIQKAPTIPLTQYYPDNPGANLQARHQDERRFLKELYPPLIEQAEKEGNEERVKEYTKEYDEKRTLMEEIHEHEAQMFNRGESLPEPETPEQSRARHEAMQQASYGQSKGKDQDNDLGY